MRPKQVGIYDVDAQKSLAVWEPETPGNYFGGALLDGDAAILALQLDYTNAYPAQFAAHVLRRFAAQPRRIHR